MTTEQPHQGIEKLNKVAAQALGDDAYKQRLINEPEKVLTEAGLDADRLAKEVDGQIASAFIRATKPASGSCCGPTCCQNAGEGA